MLADLLPALGGTERAAELALGAPIRAIALAAGLVAPGVQMAWFEHEVRVQIGAALASVRPLQQQVEDSWDRVRSVPLKLDVETLRLQVVSSMLHSIQMAALKVRLILIARVQDF